MQLVVETGRLRLSVRNPGGSCASRFLTCRAERPGYSGEQRRRSQGAGPAQAHGAVEIDEQSGAQSRSTHRSTAQTMANASPGSAPSATSTVYLSRTVIHFCEMRTTSRPPLVTV